MLDGAVASFVVTVQDHPAASHLQIEDEEFYDWAWSVDVPHHIEVGAREKNGVVLLRRWDSAGTIRRFVLPSVLRHGVDFLDALEKAGRPKGLRVLQHGLRLFRIVRESLGSTRSGDLEPIRTFHFLLRAAAACSEPEFEKRWLGVQTVGETAALLGEELPKDLGSLKLPLGIHDEFLRPEPTTGRRLNASLLLRHIAGALYQEAHLEWESSQFPLFAGHEPASRGRSKRKDVVYTPLGLARLLAELAWSGLSGKADRDRLTILDPACGSGIFLAEMFRILNESSEIPPGIDVRLVGMDVSPAAALMAQLVLGDVRRETPRADFSTSVDVEPANALREDWPICDLILMNPPFIAWDELDVDQQITVTEICGAEQGGRPDLSMAFVSLGLKALRPGGVLATVLPSPLLETWTGHKWREGLLAQATPLLIARLKGGDVFPGVMVEPALLVLRKGKPEGGTTLMGYSDPGSGEAFLRALRKRRPLGEPGKRYEVYELPTADLKAVSWLPRPQGLRTLVEELANSSARRVGDLFDVQQGIRTGANAVFVLSSDQLRRLPARERELFRPLAGTKTLRDGRIEKTQFVFYPYSEGGHVFPSEESLRSHVPRYYDEFLRPNRSLLENRSKHSGSWWDLLKPRTWQFRKEPKLVSAYFGLPGKFAFDETGEFVVGQGFAWILKSSSLPPELPADVIAEAPVPSEGADPDEVTRQVGPCYLAVFNSRCFEILLSYFAPRVLGGQFDLSPRFVNDVPVPDFLSKDAVPPDVVSALREEGEQILKGRGIDRSGRLDERVAEAYGRTLEQWPLTDAP
ncbi:MAG TPA: N-6 DNA methylase [Thermoanaerobaculia bacterium]|nr:N-6 DNA methylase [Thermoanaerobaculia bacterium]